MPNLCAVFGCNSRGGKKSDIVFHRFPKNEELRRRWIDLCKRQDAFNSNNARICSIHFEPSTFVRNIKYKLLGLPIPRSQRKVRTDAVPTLNMPTSLGNTMISMGKSAHEVREMYLSKFKQVSPYVCNSMSPRVVLLRLNSKMINKYTMQDTGKNDSLLSDDDDDWFTAVNDNWDMSLLEPIVQISSETNSQQGPEGKREGYARGKRGRLALNINRRKSPVREEIQVKQERPHTPDLVVPNDTMAILTNVTPYNPAVTMLQVPSAVLPMCVSSSQPSSKTLGKDKVNITTDHNALPHTGHPPSYGNGVMETNIKQEVTDTEVIIMPFGAAPHSVRLQDAPSKDTLSSVPSPPPKALNPPNKRRKNNSQGKTKKGTAATSDKDPSGHESLRELTTLLVELNNKNTVCDEKIQSFKDEYEKKVSVIEVEKKSNEKEIERVLLLIQNWKEGSKTKAPATTNKRARKSAR